MCLNERKYYVIFLQETYSTNRTQWEGKLFHSYCSNHNCGAMVLVKSNAEFKTDENGRYIIIEVELQGSNFLFVNIYSPNKTQQQSHFFDNLNKTLDEFVKDHLSSAKKTHQRI